MMNEISEVKEIDETKNSKPNPALSELTTSDAIGAIAAARSLCIPQEEDKKAAELKKIDFSVYDDVLEKIEEAGGMEPKHEFHDRPTHEHIKEVVSKAGEHFHGEEEVRILAMFHDLGKYATAKQKEDGGWTFPKHDAESAKIAREAGVPEYLCRIIEAHSWLYNVHPVHEKYEKTGKLTAIKRFLRNLVEGLEDPSEQLFYSLRLYKQLALCDACGFSFAGHEQRFQDLKVWEELVMAAAPAVLEELRK